MTQAQDRMIENWQTISVLREAQNKIFAGNVTLVVSQARGVKGLDTENIRGIISELASIDKRLRYEIAVLKKKIKQQGQ